MPDRNLHFMRHAACVGTFLQRYHKLLSAFDTTWWLFIDYAVNGFVLKWLVAKLKNTINPGKTAESPRETHHCDFDCLIAKLRLKLVTLRKSRRCNDLDHGLSKNEEGVSSE